MKCGRKINACNLVTLNIRTSKKKVRFIMVRIALNKALSQVFKYLNNISFL